MHVNIPSESCILCFICSFCVCFITKMGFILPSHSVIVWTLVVLPHYAELIWMWWHQGGSILWLCGWADVMKNESLGCTFLCCTSQRKSLLIIGGSCRNICALGLSWKTPVGHTNLSAGELFAFGSEQSDKLPLEKHANMLCTVVCALNAALHIWFTAFFFRQCVIAWNWPHFLYKNLILLQIVALYSNPISNV